MKDSWIESQKKWSFFVFSLKEDLFSSLRESLLLSIFVWFLLVRKGVDQDDQVHLLNDHEITAILWWLWMEEEHPNLRIQKGRNNRDSQKKRKRA